ncbi:MAG: glycosyltransferase [Roseovarius sp.]|nr:glycosyltransferase [Roseovarius sp.]
MKVLLITKTLGKGGAATGARNLADALRAAGARVTLCDASAHLRRRPLRAVRLAERVCERLFHDAETHCMRLGPATFDLEGLFERHRPDVIQLCDVSANTIRFGDIARVPCPVVHRLSDFWPYHGARHYAQQPPAAPSGADRLLRLLAFDGTCLPDCRVAPSRWLAERLGPGQAEVIHNAVAIPEGVGPRPPHRGPIRLGFVSGQVMDPRKGFDSLPPFLGALAAQDRTPVELHVFGSRPRDGLPEFPVMKPVWHPPFSRGEIGAVHAQMDILLCPSRLDNSPNVVTEALAHGVPVIGQRGTGMDSYITDETGALVEFHDASATDHAHFTREVLRLVGDHARYSRNALDYARTILHPAVIGRRYLALYDHLKSRKSP